MILKGCIYPLACLALFSVEMAAQTQLWSNVVALSPGTGIRIAGPRPGAISGTVQGVTDESIVLNSSAGQETFPRQQITRISVKKEGRRTRHALMGLGVGAGVGLGIGVASDHSCAPNSCFLGNNIGKEIFTPVGAIVGALVGVLIPSGGWRDVYRQ